MPNKCWIVDKMKCSAICCLLNMSHMSVACILLLNGWKPLSVVDRTSRAPIVLVGDVLTTYKAVRTKHQTYTSMVQVHVVHKGLERLKSIRKSHATNSYPVVYNISNFGDRSQCYADVTKEGSYIFFLTIYEGRLSAQYDDIFGAAAIFNTEQEKVILDSLGWNPWSAWSDCNTSCGEGSQSRKRNCSSDGVFCDGNHSETQQCNDIPCTEFRIPMNQTGATRRLDKHGHSHANRKKLKLLEAVDHFDDVMIPSNVSIINTILKTARKKGYLFMIADMPGICRLLCMNGGRCQAYTGKCKCLLGFKGRYCEKRDDAIFTYDNRQCKYKRSKNPKWKTYIRTVREKTVKRCRRWGWRNCRRKRQTLVTVTKKIVKSTHWRCN